MSKKTTAQELNRVKSYQQMVREFSPKSDMVGGLWRAFLVGGLICVIGQCVNYWLSHGLKLPEDSTAGLTSAIMVIAGATLTGIGVYDNIGKFAGAGSIVPITGFANSVVAPAMEFKREGYIMGVGAKLFALAGPVIVYGVSSSVLVGLIYWLLTGRGG